MVRAILACVGCVVLATVVAADTPGEEAVKSAIKTLKEKRAAMKDKADQALLDAVIVDAEERLAQVGKGEPEAMKKDEPFAMPKGWELKFNTGRNRPTFDAKTGELKLTYDFATVNQLKDFEFDKECKPAIQKGVLTIKGGEEVRHTVGFTTFSVTADVSCGQHGPLMKAGAYRLDIAWNNTGDFFVVREGGKELTTVPLGRKRLNQPIPVKAWYVSPRLIGVKVGANDSSAKREAQDGTAGHLTLCAEKGANSFRGLTLTGTLDPEWAKQFFADKK